MPFGFANRFPGPSEYITLIRDPIARAISDYHFCRTNSLNPAHGAACALSLTEFVERGYGFSQNCYARWLSNAAFGAKFRHQDEMLQEALNNLARFSWVGITEEFDLSVKRICARCGLIPHATREGHRNRATPEARHVSAEEREFVGHFNRLDQAIYEECRKSFVREPGTHKHARGAHA